MCFYPPLAGFFGNDGNGYGCVNGQCSAVYDQYCNGVNGYWVPCGDVQLVSPAAAVISQQPVMRSPVVMPLSSPLLPPPPVPLLVRSSPLPPPPLPLPVAPSNSSNAADGRGVRAPPPPPVAGGASSNAAYTTNPSYTPAGDAASISSSTIVVAAVVVPVATVVVMTGIIAVMVVLLRRRRLQHQQQEEEASGQASTSSASGGAAAAAFVNVGAGPSKLYPEAPPNWAAPSHCLSPSAPNAPPYWLSAYPQPAPGLWPPPSAPPPPSNPAAASLPSGADLCVVCQDAPALVGFLHGSTVHRCVCAGCAERIGAAGRCPVCRAQVEKVLHVFV